MVTAPHFPYLLPQSPACANTLIAVRKRRPFAYLSILARRNKWDGAALHHGFVNRLRVIGAITREADNRFIAWYLRH